MASGLAGGAAGIATAIDVMQRNAEATERHHIEGMKMEAGGRKTVEEAIKCKERINSQKYEEFEYSDIDEKLINEINIEFKEVEDYGTDYVELKVVVNSKKDEYDFPNSKSKSKIDGSFCINLYSKENNQLLAKGYYIAKGRYGNNKTVTGYSTQKVEEVVVLKKQPKIKFNLQKEYTISISEPYLWLLKI